MKGTLYLVLCTLVLLISCSESRIESIGIDNIKEQLAYQDSILNRANGVDSAKFRILRELISQYREIQNKKVISNPNYINYLARLYEKIDEIPSSFFYDSTSHTVPLKNVYEFMYDSAVYFSNRLIELRPNDVTGYFILSQAIYFDQVRAYTNNWKPIKYLPLSKRFPSVFNNSIYTLNNNLDQIISFDTSSKKEMSQLVSEILIWLKKDEIFRETNGVISSANLNDYSDRILELIIFIKDYSQKFSTNKKYIFIDESNRKVIAGICAISPFAKKILEKRHLWDNVTADVYSNGNCNKIWIYSNGRYTQQLYKQNIGSLPYHEQMNVSSYDLINCSVKNLPLLITHSSRGKWTKNGGTYYFYPDDPANYVLAGYDDKGRKYMYLNSYGNLEFLRDDYQTVVMRLENKDCASCVNKSAEIE